MNDPYSTRSLAERVDLAAIAAWTAANDAARRAYIEKPNACTWAIYLKAGR